MKVFLFILIIMVLALSSLPATSSTEEIMISEPEILVGEPNEIHILCNELELSIVQDEEDDYPVKTAPSLGDCQAQDDGGRWA